MKDEKNSGVPIIGNATPIIGEDNLEARMQGANVELIAFRKVLNEKYQIDLVAEPLIVQGLLVAVPRFADIKNKPSAKVDAPKVDEQVA